MLSAAILLISNHQQAHPGGFRQVYDLEIQLLPHGLPFVQTLQQLLPLVVEFDLEVARTAGGFTKIGGGSTFITGINTFSLIHPSLP